MSSSSSDVHSGDDVFVRAVLERTVYLQVAKVGRSYRKHMRDAVKETCEGRCVEEGYIKVDSVKVLSYSCGIAQADVVAFKVAFECLVCYPTEGMVIACYAKEITKAGIRAEVYPNDALEQSKPLMIFIARDHHYNRSEIQDVAKGDQIRVRCIGVRFELNDTFIGILAEYVGPMGPTTL